MMLYLALITALGSSACSQHSDFHINAQDRFTFGHLPQVGEDCSGTIKGALDWAFDPKRTSSLPGYCKFKVTNAVVFASDSFVPRPTGASSTLRFHLHVNAVLPSGQVIDEDGVEEIDGVWVDQEFVLSSFGGTVFPAVLDKAGADKVYADLSLSHSSDAKSEAEEESSAIRMLFGIPIKASGTVDLSNWQKIHDIALTRHDLLEDKP